MFKSEPNNTIWVFHSKIRATSWCSFDKSSSDSINIVDFLLKTITARSQPMAKEKTCALIFLTDVYLCLSLSKIYYKRPCTLPFDSAKIHLFADWLICLHQLCSLGNNWLLMAALLWLRRWLAIYNFILSRITPLLYQKVLVF